ncbi:MAG: chemotaxis protein CheW [Thermovirga sp.]
MDSIVVFRLAAQKYGVPIETVREIIPCSDITPAPGTPSFFEGFLNVRGELISVTNLNRFIGISEPVDPKTARILILTTAEGVSRGVLTDDVTSIASFSPEDLQPVKDGKNRAGFSRELLKGVADTGQELVVILDVEKLLSGDQTEEESS